MNASDLGKLVWIVSDAGKVLLLYIILRKQLYRTFRLFFGYVLWDLISDVVLYLTLAAPDGYLGHHYAPIYYTANIILYLLEFGVLLEVASVVLQPAKRVFPRGTLYFVSGAMLILGVISFMLAIWVNPTPFANFRFFLVLNTAAAILCLITFLLIAGFSQILGLSWKNHVLQLATGLAFFSVVELTMELMQSQLHPGPSYLSQYRMWGQIEVIGYLCTLSFWCYAFLKKEAPRKEFSPQMAKILVSLSSGAKRQHAVLARSRDD